MQTGDEAAEPYLAYRCGQCKAESGEPCTGSPSKTLPVHVSRQDKHARALRNEQRRERDARDARLPYAWPPLQ